MKKISVVTATYNRGYCIGRAIRSVLDQTHANFEYIIVDDGSSDDTRQVVESFNDPRLRYVRYETNETHAARYPQTLNTCTGDYIMRIDSDDYLISKTVFETMIRNLDASPAEELVHGYSWIDERTQKNVNYFQGWANGRSEIKFEDFLLGTKGYADILWIAKRKYIDNFYKYFRKPFNWYTGLWEALQPDGVLVLFQEPMGIAGWGGTDNVSTFNTGQRLWDMCSEYNTYLAERYFSILIQKPRRLGYFYQWAAYYDLLLGRKIGTIKNIFKGLRYDPTNSRLWAILILWPLNRGSIHFLLRMRSKMKWTFRTKGDWRS